MTTIAIDAAGRLEIPLEVRQQLRLTDTQTLNADSVYFANMKALFDTFYRSFRLPSPQLQLKPSWARSFGNDDIPDQN